MSGVHGDGFLSYCKNTDRSSRGQENDDSSFNDNVDLRLRHGGCTSGRTLAAAASASDGGVGLLGTRIVALTMRQQYYCNT